MPATKQQDNRTCFDFLRNEDKKNTLASQRLQPKTCRPPVIAGSATLEQADSDAVMTSAWHRLILRSQALLQFTCQSATNTDREMNKYIQWHVPSYIHDENKCSSSKSYIRKQLAYGWVYVRKCRLKHG